jgi:Rap1a immunity proteins
VKTALLVHRPYYGPPVGFGIRIGPVTIRDILMRKVLLAGVAALLMATSAANAQVTGDVLLKWCTKNNQQCDAYLLGVTDTIIALSPSGICMPDTTVKQQRAVVVSFLKERPHHLKYLVVDVILKAYEEAWPCPK